MPFRPGRHLLVVVSSRAMTMEGGFPRMVTTGLRGLPGIVSLLLVLLVAGVAGGSAGSSAAHAATGSGAGYVLPPSQGQPPFPSCPAFGVIGSRGSGENQGSDAWDLGVGPPELAFAQAIGKLLSGVQFTANPPPGYPAVSLTTALTHLNAYRASVASGRDQLEEMVASQRGQCGDKTKLYLAGYSQGAELTGDAYLAELQSRPKDAAIVAGVVLFGDPLYNLTDASDVQTPLQRSQHANLHHNGALTVHGLYHVAPPHSFPHATIGKVLSYCLINDLICQGTGGNPFSHQHSAYPANSGPQEAAKWFAAQASPLPLAVDATLGLEWASNQTGYGQVKPSTINNGGDPTGVVTHVRWSHWGEKQAIGSGIGDWVWPGQCVACGSIQTPATVVAFDLGTCDGKVMYQKVDWYFPTKGEAFDPRFFINICTGTYSTYEPKMTSCGSTAIASPPGQVSQIQARGVSCVRAQQIILSAQPSRFFKKDGGRWITAGLYCGTSGYDPALSPPPILYECARGGTDIIWEFSSAPAVSPGNP